MVVFSYASSYVINELLLKLEEELLELLKWASDSSFTVLFTVEILFALYCSVELASVTLSLAEIQPIVKNNNANNKKIVKIFLWYLIKIVSTTSLLLSLYL